MREEISEPQHWRSNSNANPSWSTRRRAGSLPMAAELPLSAEAVDAAFTEEGPLGADRLDAADIDADAQSYPELIASLTDQLAQLEAQREQLQKLLAETSDCQS